MQDQNKEITIRNYGIALGANLDSTFGSPLETLRSSLGLFGDEALTIIRQSRWFSTPAFPAGSGPDFVNAAVLVQSEASPNEVLAALHRIEQTLGRTRENRWEPRICDLDLVFCDDQVLPDKRTFTRWQNLDPAQQKTEAPSELILPHPRLQDRSFVLVPMQDVAPDWHHPVSGKSIKQMIENLPDREIAEIKVIST